MEIYYILIILAIMFILIIAIGIRIVRPTHQMIVETLGSYTKTCTAGFHWIVPIIQRSHYINMTEQMNDVRPQTVITKDNLNATVDSVVYHKIKDAKSSLYNVDNYLVQIGSLTRTTLRNVIGNMTFSEANSKRDQINQQVEQILQKETKSYGIDILRVELQKVEAPQDVQEAMNDVVKAERNKLSAKDFANAEEIKADGRKRASIKEAEGVKESKILRAKAEAEARLLEADAKAKAIKLENEAAEKYFKGNAQMLKKLEVTNESLRDNAKIIVPQGSELINIIGDIAGTPIIKKQYKNN